MAVDKYLGVDPMNTPSQAIQLLCEDTNSVRYMSDNFYKIFDVIRKLNLKPKVLRKFFSP